MSIGRGPTYFGSKCFCFVRWRENVYQRSLAMYYEVSDWDFVNGDPVCGESDESLYRMRPDIQDTLRIACRSKAGFSDIKVR